MTRPSHHTMLFCLMFAWLGLAACAGDVDDLVIVRVPATATPSSDVEGGIKGTASTPLPEPTPKPTATPSATPSPTPTPTATPTAAPTPTPTPTATPTAEPTPTILATPDPTPTPATVSVIKVSPKSVVLNVPAPGGVNAPGFLSGHTFSATVLMSDLTSNEAVTWSSSDPSRATVDANGKVSALRAGTVVITATAKGSSLSDSATVTILSLGQVQIIVH